MRRALITGSSGGLGRTLCRRLAASGYKVIGLDVTDGQALGDAAEYLTVDADLKRMVRDETYCTSRLSVIRDSLEGPLSLLVNNAAVQIVRPTATLGLDDIQGSLDVNVVAPILLAREFLGDLEKVGGSIVNISSIHARLTKPGFVAYATSKAALSGMTRAMAVDLRHRVRVNAIEPAALDTDMLRAGFVGDPEGYAALAEVHPLGRIGQTEEVAELVLALDSGVMQFVHGACLPIDGGIGCSLLDPAAIAKY